MTTDVVILAPSPSRLRPLLTFIAAVVIGGASLNGGKGTVAGALIGVLVLGLLANGVSLFNVPVEVRYILEGGIILLNAALSRWERAKAR